MMTIGLVEERVRPDLAKQIDAMITRFNDEDTLILCVVAATTGALMNDTAVGKALTLGKLNKTLLCLTKCDQIQDVDTAERCIFDRILKGSELEDCGLSGLVGVAATACLNGKSADQGKYFTDILKQVKSEHIQRMITELPSWLGSSNVLRLLDSLFFDHTEIKWKPGALVGIAQLTTEQQNQLTALGPDPGSVTPNQVFNEVFARLNMNNILTAIDAHAKKDNQSPSAETLPQLNFLSQPKIDLITPLEVTTVDNYHQYQNQVAQFNSRFCDTSEYRLWLIKLISDEIEKVFTAQDDPTLKIGRFAKFKQLLMDMVKQKIMDKKNSENDKNDYLQEARHCSVLLRSFDENWKILHAAAGVVLSSRAVKTLNGLTAFVESVKEKPLVECPEVAGLRKKYTQHLNALDNHKKNIEGLKEGLRYSNSDLAFPF
jgi:hypothetical protein